MSDFVSSREAQKIYKVAEQTLRDWATSGKINYITTAGGHRRYCVIKPQDNRKKYIIRESFIKKTRK